MHEDSRKNGPSFPWLPSGTAFTMARAAQKPRAAEVVQNACLITMAIMQASRPAPQPLSTCKLTSHLHWVNLHIHS